MKHPSVESVVEDKPATFTNKLRQFFVALYSPHNASRKDFIRIYVGKKQRELSLGSMDELPSKKHREDASGLQPTGSFGSRFLISALA